MIVDIGFLVDFLFQSPLLIIILPLSSGIHGFEEEAGSNPLKSLHPLVSPPDLEGFSLTFCSLFMVCPFEDCFYLSSLF